MTDIQLTGNARIAGLERDLGLTDRQYQICITTLYVPYILSEIPSNLILKYVGPRWVLPTIITVWGAITCLQGRKNQLLIQIYSCLNSPGTVTNFSGLLAARFFLGMVEGPMLPSIVLYLSAFYTRQELSMKFVGPNHNISMWFLYVYIGSQHSLQRPR